MELSEIQRIDKLEKEVQQLKEYNIELQKFLLAFYRMINLNKDNRYPEEGEFDFKYLVDPKELSPQYLHKTKNKYCKIY